MHYSQIIHRETSSQLNKRDNTHQIKIKKPIKYDVMLENPVIFIWRNSGFFGQKLLNLVTIKKGDEFKKFCLKNLEKSIILI